MNALQRWATILAAAWVVVSCGGPGAQEDADTGDAVGAEGTPMPGMPGMQGMQDSKPAGEMEQLVKLLNGRWEMAVTYAPSEMAPQGFTGTGQEVNRPGPGGFSVLVESISSSPAGAFEGFGVINWSAGEAAYKLHWFTNASPVPAMFTGTWKETDIVFSGTETVMGQELASRHSITNIKPGSFDYAIDMGPTAAALTRFITIHYTRADSKE